MRLGATQAPKSQSNFLCGGNSVYFSAALGEMMLSWTNQRNPYLVEPQIRRNPRQTRDGPADSTAERLRNLPSEARLRNTRTHLSAAIAKEVNLA